MKVRMPSFLYTSTSRGGVRCVRCKKEIKVGKTYRWGIVRVRGTLTRLRFHQKCL